MLASAFALVMAAVVAASPILETPTRDLRQKALTEFAQGDTSKAQAALLEAGELVQKQQDPYVKANELRYIADAWARLGDHAQAAKAFAESMDVAITIPTWNHRLYASIGVVEMQRATGDLDGTYANGMKALNSGLLKKIAQTGHAAEMGRFFTALDGLLSEQEHETLKQRIRGMGNALFQRKAIHALDNTKVKQETESKQ